MKEPIASMLTRVDRLCLRAGSALGISDGNVSL